MNLETPKNISYTFIVHAGSYKDFEKKVSVLFPELKLRFSKQRSVHYYVLQFEEENSSEKAYSKDKIYEKLPIMAMREEFSSYVFLKSMKAYNNILKIMFGGEKNKEAPYELISELLTCLEKYMLIKNNESYCFTVKEKEREITKFFYEDCRFSKEAQELMFDLNCVVVGKEKILFSNKLKEGKAFIGIV